MPGIPIRFLDRPAASDPVEARTARLTALAVRVFRSEHKAMRWLNRPRTEFGGVAPLEMMDTPAGGRQVEMLLRAMEDLPAE